MGAKVVIFGIVLLAPVAYLGVHKYRVMNGHNGLPFAQEILSKIDEAAGTSLAPKGMTITTN